MTMISTKNLRLSSMPQLEIHVRQCGRLPNRPGVSPTRVSSAAHRAFYRTPGRAQTAAFAGPVRSTAEPPRRSASADQTRLRDCMTTHRASIEPRSDSSSVADDEEPSTTSIASTTKTATSRNKDRDLYRRPRSQRPEIVSKTDRVVDDVIGRHAGTTAARDKTATKSRPKIVKASVIPQSSFSSFTSSTSSTLPPPGNVDRTTSSDFEAVTSLGNGESSMSATPTGEMKSSDSSLMMSAAVPSCGPQLVVYHFVGSSDRRRTAERSETSTVLCEEEGDDVSKYSVDVQGDIDGLQNSAAGLSRDSPKNDILQDLLRRQLALVSLSRPLTVLYHVPHSTLLQIIYVFNLRQRTIYRNIVGI